MTFAEILDVGRECLVEYEPRLKVLGQKPWDASANDSLCVKLTVYPSSLVREDMRRVISALLDGLAALEDGFIMSGPKFTVESEGTIQSVTYKNLSLSFANAYDVNNNENTIRVNCWYYPAS
jgi:hypothetical protein